MLYQCGASKRRTILMVLLIARRSVSRQLNLDGRRHGCAVASHVRLAGRISQIGSSSATGSRAELSPSIREENSTGSQRVARTRWTRRLGGQLRRAVALSGVHSGRRPSFRMLERQRSIPESFGLRDGARVTSLFLTGWDYGSCLLRQGLRFRRRCRGPEF